MALPVFEQDIAYGVNALHRMDVYRPEGTTADSNAPVIFMVHGGGWQNPEGDKANPGVIQNKAAYWLAKGYIVISINYRLWIAGDPTNVSPYEEALDVGTALAYAQANVEGVDPSKFYLMGHSAGAHLVALVATSAAIKTATNFTTPVKVVCLDSGALDIETILDGPMTPDMEDLYEPFTTNTLKLTSMNPYAQVHAAIDCMLVYSTQRGYLDKTQSESFATKVRQFSGTAVVYPVNLSHSQIDDQLGLPSSYTNAVNAFLEDIPINQIPVPNPVPPPYRSRRPMGNSFEPFDKFERECSLPPKAIKETMQENCNTNFPAQKESCNKRCAPWWQKTGEKRCNNSNGFLELEEADGCGHTRFVRSELMQWTDTTDTRDDPGGSNQKQKKQTNQCGDERWVFAGSLWCTPNWVNDPDAEVDCSQSMEQIRQLDGCGHTRMHFTGNPVNWIMTGDVQCLPGDIYQVKQSNQCGGERWITVDGGCPCIPDWTATSTQRCTGAFVENQEQDGCGHTRYTATADPVVWTPTGDTQCSPAGLVQNKEVNNCGTFRWVNTEDTCSNAAPPMELGDLGIGDEHHGSHSAIVTFKLQGSTKKITASGFDEGNGSFDWVSGAIDRSQYEAKFSLLADESYGSSPPGRYYAGSAMGTWLNLGEVDVIGGTFGISLDDPVIPTNWNNITCRIDIRRVGHGAEGGASIGPFKLSVGG